MITLAIRTDKPEAELHLLRGLDEIAHVSWHGHRKLSGTLHAQIDSLLASASLTIRDVTKIVFYEGPGSFTGLRIGCSTANALGYSLNIPVVAAGGEDWIHTALQIDAAEFSPVVPVYGADPHITSPKK